MREAHRLALLDEAATLRHMAALARSDGRSDLAEDFEARAEENRGLAGGGNDNQTTEETGTT